MQRFLIVNGDKTSTGGIIAASQEFATNMNKALVMLGDQATCPACKIMGYIVPDGPRLKNGWMGKQVALNDDVVICGCGNKPRIINSLSNLKQNIDDETLKIQAFSQTTESNQGKIFQFIHSETNELLTHRKYIAIVDGETKEGVTDGNGYAYIASRLNSEISVHLIFKSPKGNLIPHSN